MCLSVRLCFVVFCVGLAFVLCLCFCDENIAYFHGGRLKRHYRHIVVCSSVLLRLLLCLPYPDSFYELRVIYTS